MRHAHAKVNLWLNVVGRRADGYHLLDSLVAFVDLADTLVTRPADRLSLELDGPYAAELARDPDNLVLKAARLLADRAGVTPRAAIALRKHIPVAAGLGGGSADAAAVLRELVDLWHVVMAEDELFDLARSLGADVPMCLAGSAALVSGVGERLSPAPPLPPAAILLVNPGTASRNPHRSHGHGAIFRNSQPNFCDAATISARRRSRCDRPSPTYWRSCAPAPARAMSA